MQNKEMHWEYLITGLQVVKLEVEDFIIGL